MVTISETSEYEVEPYKTDESDWTITHIPLELHDRLAAPIPSRRTRFMKGVGNLALLGGVVANSLNPDFTCPINEVLADRGSLAAQLSSADGADFLRVSTLNTYESRLGNQGIIEAINAQRSHIFALQEVNTDSLEEIEAGTDYTSVLLGYAHRGKGGSYGVALLTNLPVVSKNTYGLNPDSGDERRVVLAVELEYEGEVLVVFVVHLINKQPGYFGDHRDEQRVDQTQNLLEVTHKYIGKRQIIVGDFNAGPMDEVRKMIERTGFADSSQQMGVEVPTFPFDGSNKDAIMTSRNWQIKPLELSIWGGNISDHCGITTTYQVPKTRRK